MDFSFTEEQQMLQETTRRFLTDRYNFEKRQRICASDAGWSREIWTQLGELGLLAINIPEADGGIGAGPVATMLASSAFGASLSLEPFGASAVVATEALVQLAWPEQRTQWLPKLASGECVAVLVQGEENSEPYATPNIIATHTADGWELTGCEPLVYHAPTADVLLVPARTDDGIGIFLVAKDAQGLALTRYATIDEQCAADVALERVVVGAHARLGGEATQTLQRVRDIGVAALCADALGAMESIFKATIEYSRTRTQFGVPIGSFQALQHRMAEMLMHLEQARSMCYLATMRCTDADAAARATALSAAKTLMGKAARYIGQQAIQLHGGMGMTDELDVSHYFRRLLAFELRGGSSEAHLERFRATMVAAA